jgi:protein gp37
MGYPTPIEWTDATWNPVGGCEIHSPGCINCYAQRIAGSGRLRKHPLYSGVTKLVKGKPVFNGVLTALPVGHHAWQWPISWRGAVNPRLGPGMPSLIFIADMADLFHRDRPTIDIDFTLAPIVYSRHIGLLLTKRADVMADYFRNLKAGRWLEFHHPRFGEPNWDPAVVTFDAAIKSKLWLGFSAERQQEFDERWRHIEPLARDGWQVFVSCEPLLGRILLPGSLGAMPKKPWIIAGGESGPGARAAYPGWFRDLERQCDAMGLPFFFKQWGAHTPYQPQGKKRPDFYINDDGDIANEATALQGGSWSGMFKAGKETTGNLLDGIQRLQFPEAA